jgi:predicted site-specific integrase-resolvase
MQEVNSGAVFVGPPMDQEAYAKAVGVSFSTIKNQVNRGLLPTIKVGRRRYINTYALAANCLQEAKGE